MSSKRTHWAVKASQVSKRTVNPIRNIVDGIKVAPNPNKKVISLALGDPTVGGSFKIHAAAVEAVKSLLISCEGNGYPPSFGDEAARASIAKEYSRPGAELTSKDVILGSGCSDALYMSIGALCDEGSNILLPSPGFPLYVTIACNRNVETRFYNLLPNKGWEVDLAQLETLIDEKTSCLLLNNPSNPCGSSYSKEHLIAILKVAERHHLPVISDEIYADMVFRGESFYPVATLTTTVPVLSVGGLAKRFLVPGWRVGWICVHDRNDIFKDVRPALVSMSQVIIGANSLIQKSLPEIFAKVPKSFHHETMDKLESNARAVIKVLSKARGLRPVLPQGTMYIMVEVLFDQFKSEISDISRFAEALLAEESVMCLPGTCFKCPNFFRVVFTLQASILEEACGRIAEFCARHTLPACEGKA